MSTYNGFKSIEGKEFYERTLMHALKENNILLQFAKKATLPKNHGDVITWRKRKPVAVQVDGYGKVRKLTEGVTPTPNKLEFVEYKATIAEYGDWIKLTKKLTNLAIDPVLTEASEGLGESAGDTFDQAIKEVIYANPNVYYAGGKAANTIAATDYLTVADLHRIKATFKKRNVKPFSDGYYILIISPEVEFDFKNNATVNASWIDISKYSDAERKNIAKGEVGRIFGFKVIVYNKLDSATGLGAYEAPDTEGSVSAVKCIAFGADAFGTVDLEGNSAAAPKVFYNAPGTVGNDPLKQRHSVAWKNEGWTARIIYPEALTIVYAPSSLSISAYSESSSDVNYYNNTGVAGPNSYQAYDDYTSGAGLDLEDWSGDRDLALALAVDAYTNNSTDLFGKTVNNLQSNISIVNNNITGTLKYISDYSSAYGESMKTGHFIVLQAQPKTDVTITVEVVGGTVGAQTLDSDGICICRITSTSQSIRFVATKGSESLTKTFTLTDLTLESA